MIYGPGYIFIHLEKCAGMHISNILTSDFGGTVVQGRTQHNTLLKKPEDKLVFGSVVNPWKWYVSLWAMYCLKRGGEWRAILRTDRAKFCYPHNIFGDINSARRFQEWLLMMLDNKNPWFRRRLKKKPKGKKYGQFRRFDFRACKDLDIGHYSYRYGQLFLADQWELLKSGKNYFLDDICRCENLEKDLVKILQKVGIDVEESVLRQYKRVNSTVYNRNSYSYYYNQKCKCLVGHKDRYIIQKYGYEFE